MKILFRCEECFINWSTVFYVTSKPNKVQLCIPAPDAKSVNIPLYSFAKTANNRFFKVIHFILFDENKQGIRRNIDPATGG